MKKIIFILLVLTISCSSYSNDNANTAFTGFYSSPEDIITKYGSIPFDKAGYREHFLLGISYNKTGQKKTALFHFANSSFKNKRIQELKLFPYPVYKFINGFHIKSELFNDSVYEIAELFYTYREFEYVIKFTDLIKKSGAALYRDSVILKSKALFDLGKHDESLACIRGLETQFRDINSVSLISIRAASAFENQNLIKEAIDEYLKIIRLDNKSWQSGIACKRISELLKKNNIVLNDQDKFILAVALYNNSEIACIGIFNELIKNGSNINITDLNKFTVKAYVQNNDPGKADKLIAALKNDIPLYNILIKTKADEFWSLNKKLSAFQLYQDLIKSNDSEISRESLRKITEYLISREREYRDYAEKFIENNPEDASSEFFLRSLARDELKKNNVKTSAEYMEKALKIFPNSQHTAWHRFWLYKIYTKTNDIKNAKNIFRDMVLLNPDSSYTWKILSQTVSAYNANDLKSGFESAVLSRNANDSLFYHMLLFAHDKNFAERDARISRLDFVQEAGNIKDLKRRLSMPEYNARLKENIKLLKTYFQTGYNDGINRELELFTGDEFKTDKNTAIYILGITGNYYSFSYASLSRLLADSNIAENLSLLPEKMLKILYPLAFKEMVEAASKESAVEKEIIYAVMKAESSFNHRAVSSAGATGLMQLMPLTAKDIADQTGLKIYDLKNPRISINFGAKYLSWLAKFFNRDLSKMTAGYNAGAGFVQKWQKSQYNDDYGIDYFIEFIPFQETRNYILRTDEYYAKYKLIYPQY